MAQQLSEVGQIVNDLRDAGFGFDYPGMICEEHGGRAIGLLDMERAQRNQMAVVAVIPCNGGDEDRTIWMALDMLTFPGGIDAWFVAQRIEATIAQQGG